MISSTPSHTLRTMTTDCLPEGERRNDRDITAKAACKPTRRGTMQLCRGPVCDGHSFWPPSSFRISTILRTGPASASPRSNFVIVTAEFSSQGRKDLFSINAGVAKFAVAVAALIVQPVNLAHQTRRSSGTTAWNRGHRPGHHVRRQVQARAHQDFSTAPSLMTVSRRTSAGVARSFAWNLLNAMLFDISAVHGKIPGAPALKTSSSRQLGRVHRQVLFRVGSRFRGPSCIPHRIDRVRFIASSLWTSPGWWVTSLRVT